MKKIIYILALVIVSTSAYTQSTPKNRWNIGGDFGMSRNYFATSRLHAKDGDFGFTGGIIGTYQLNNNFTIESGIRLTNKVISELTNFRENAQYSIYLDAISIDQIKYIDMPFMIGYNVKIINNLSITPKLGGYLAYGYDSEGFTENSNFGLRVMIFDDLKQQVPPGNVPDNKWQFYAFKRFDYGVNLGVDINYKQFTLRCRYGIGMQDIINKKYDSKGRLRSLSMSVGYYIFKH